MNTEPSPIPIRVLTNLMRNLMRQDAATARRNLDELAGRFDALVALLQQHRLGGYFYILIMDTPLLSTFPDEIVSHLQEKYHRQAETCRRNLRLIAEIQQRFDNAAIPFLTMKGLYQSRRFFGDFSYRFMWDLDILMRPGDLDAAIAQLQKLGLALPLAGSVDVRKRFWGIHAVELQGNSGKVDVHVALRNFPGMHFDYDAIWRKAHPFEANGVRLPTLCDEDNLLTAALGMGADIQRGAHNLRKIWDIYVMLLQLDPVLDWEAFLACREREGSLKLVLNTFAFVLHLLAVSDDCPQLATVMTPRKSQLLITSEVQANIIFTRPRKHIANRIFFSRLVPVSSTVYWAQWLLLLPMRSLFYIAPKGE